MHHNTIVLDMLQKFDGYFQGIEPRFHTAGMYLHEIRRDLHRWMIAII